MNVLVIEAEDFSTWQCADSAFESFDEEAATCVDKAIAFAVRQIDSEPDDCIIRNAVVTARGLIAAVVRWNLAMDYRTEHFGIETFRYPIAIMD